MEIGLICVSGLADLEAVRAWCSTASEVRHFHSSIVHFTPEHLAQKLERDGLMKALVGTITKGTTEYAVGDLSIPGLRHFLYKSRPQVQVTAPRYEDPYDEPNERRRCVIIPLHASLLPCRSPYRAPPPSVPR